MHVKMESGLEKAPFLMQFKGQNGLHEGDREKASSVMANLTYIPASALGRFKYIFSEKLRKKYFERIDRKTIEIKEDNKYSHGQVSKEEANEILKHQEHMRVIDVLWTFN